MSYDTDPKGILGLSSNPELIDCKTKRRGVRYQKFEEWVRQFISITGCWPGGPDFQDSHELEDFISEGKLLRELYGWTEPLTEEVEYDDNASFISAKTVIPAIRRKISNIKYLLFIKSLPQLYRDSGNQLVWKRSDVDSLILLASRHPKVYNGPFYRDLRGGLINTISLLPMNKKTNDRSARQHFIEANLRHLSDWQLQQMQEFILAGPETQLQQIPAAPPRLWKDRSVAEASRGRGFIDPATFIRAVWGPWLGGDHLNEDELEARDPELVSAYRQWVQRHKEARIKELAPGTTPLQRRVYGISRHTPWEEVERIALAVVKDRQRKRNRKPEPS